MTSRSDFCSLTAEELIAGFKHHDFSPVEVTQAVLERTALINPKINAFFHISPDEALAAAHASEKRWLDNEPSGLLDGVPVSIKDSVATKDTPRWLGARAFIDRPWSTSDSPPAARLRESGAVIFAKTTMPDLGMFGAGVSTAHGITRNPWDLRFNTGGSSSGGCAALASRLGPLTVGTDIGGSLRLPAGMCGLTSIKPTQGRVPHLPPSPMRSAGPISRTVRDCALMLSVLAQPDGRDHSSLPPEGLAYHEHLDRDVKGLKIGLMLDMGFGLPLDDAVRKAVTTAAHRFSLAGAHVELVQPLNMDPMEAIERIFAVRLSVELNRLPMEQHADVHHLIRKMCRGIDRFTSAMYGESMDLLEGAKSEFLARTTAFDYVLTPILPVVGFPAEDVGPDPTAPMSVGPYTILLNQTGQPAASVCCGFDERGLPIGLQIIGPRFDDLGVLQIASFYENARDFTMKWPN